jgi:hypothetical protein
MRRESVIRFFPILLPLAVRWVRRQQRRILRDGISLLAHELSDARAVGVLEPEKVRLLPVELVPWPVLPLLRKAGEAIGFVTGATRGLTLGYGIFIRSDCWRDRALIAHELVHTAQYERFGGIEPFLRQYLIECLTVGYNDAPLEQEAGMVSRKIVDMA